MDALAHLPLPVVVVAAAADEARSCATATATYVSFEPARLVVPLAVGSRTGALARAAGEFSVSVLSADQAELAVRAAAVGEDTFAGQAIDLVAPPANREAPGIAGSVATFWCDLESAFDLDGRTLLVGRVREAQTSAREPLLRFGRRYRSLGRAIDVAAEAAYPL